MDWEHHIPCSSKTKSGINVAVVIERLVREKEQLNLLDGPGISNHKGEILTSASIDGMMHETLEELFNESLSMFPPDILKKIWLNIIIASARLGEHPIPEPWK